MSTLNILRAAHGEQVGAEIRDLLGALVQVEQRVGDVYSLAYEEALVLINDRDRRRVGGIPALITYP